MNRDQEIGSEEHIDVIELKVLRVVHMLQHSENVMAVLFGLRALRAMATVLNLQFVQLEAARKLIEFWRRRIGDIKPLQM
jgi:hypothetical protein